MDATRVLVRAAAAAMVVTALTAPAADAADESCHGRPATIVGERYELVAGTDGDDVIVTNNASGVSAGNGDDTICVTGDRTYLEIRAGAGDDLVDTTAYALWTVAILGAGADTYIGGAGRDEVFAGERTPELVDDAPDTIDTGSDNDYVVSGQPGLVNDDDVDLGEGADGLILNSDRTTGTLSGGDTEAVWDRLVLRVSETGDWTVDDEADVAVHGGETSARWTDFFVNDVWGTADTVVSYLGTSHFDKVRIVSAFGGAMFGGGDDDLALEPVGSLTGLVDGGPGRDALGISHRSGRVLIDLGTGQFGTSFTTPTAGVTGVEQARAWSFAARVYGSAGADRLAAGACRAELRGGPGPDRIRFGGSSRWCQMHSSEPPSDVRVFGGSGDDVLFGSRDRELLAGGPGLDRVTGYGGPDRCRAEQELRCKQ